MSTSARLDALLLHRLDPSTTPQFAQYAPVLYFDEAEPFLPLAVGCTRFDSPAPSPSFPRMITLHDDHFRATYALEYAIWWDWDIEHLYELEHIWVWIDEQGQVVHAEGSWHGLYHELIFNGHLQLEAGHIVALSEAGKHAFAPVAEWYEVRRAETEQACRQVGRGGVHITPLYKDIITSKNEANDAAVRRYLTPYAFTPTWQFTHRYAITDAMLVPWAALQAWIPLRVQAWVDALAAGRTSLE